MWRTYPSPGGADPKAPEAPEGVVRTVTPESVEGLPDAHPAAKSAADTATHT